MAWIWSLIVGIVAGAIAGYIRKDNFGLVGNMVVGVIGSFIGYWLLHLIAPSAQYGWFGDIVVSTIGALVLLAAVSFLKKQ